MTGMTQLGTGEEFDRIRSVIKGLGTSAQSIGDDAAVLDVPRDQKLVVSTDSSVENVHFRRAWLTPEEIGYRATAAALSDMAAMGATPMGILLAIAIAQADTNLLEPLAAGAADAARDSGVAVVGGDLSASATLVIAVTVFGAVSDPLLRSAARPGDRVYVTGEIGGTAIALEAFLRGLPAGAKPRERFAKPHPRINEAIWLAQNGATACVDVSDGMPGDLGHIAAASGVNVIVDVDKIPLFPGASLENALASGEEYELCITSPVDIDTQEFRTRFGIPLTRIGSVEASTSPVVVFRKAGAVVEVPDSYSHFTK